MKIVIVILLVLASIVVVTATDQYLFCPVYNFTESAPFRGDSIYNPYASSLPQDWVKCNFHSHAHCWDGFTYGYGTPNDIFDVYNNMHYGIHAVSNYQYIDTTSHLLPDYIGCYEHGYNMLKSHQLVIGASEVCWKDYLLPQTINNKQDILNRLSATSNNQLLVINHPMVRNGYSASDFTHLSRYNCMEVLNPACNSSALWDAALSVGKPVFIVGDDDSHRVLDSTNAGKICTWVNVPKPTKNNVVTALKTGCSYAMTIGKPLMQQERHDNNDSMPMLESFVMKDNSMNVTFSLAANEIKIIGENGAVLDSAKATNAISYSLGEKQPYARVVATYNNGTEIFLNPVFRYNGSPLQQSVVGVNNNETLLLRTLGVIILLFWFGFVIKVFYPKKKMDDDFEWDEPTGILV